MLAPLTYGLVVAAVGAVVGGFLMQDSNVLLFVAIGLSLAALVLIAIGWARRAKQGPVGFEGDELVFEDEGFGETPAGDLLDALEDEELMFIEERPRRSKAKAKPKATAAKAKPKARSKSASKGKARGAKPKSTARAKSAGRSKRKPSGSR